MKIPLIIDEVASEVDAAVARLCDLDKEEGELLREYQFRRLQVTGDERYQDKPLKNDCSHVCEALHYALLGAGEGILTRKRQWSDSEVAEWRRWHETALPAHVFE